MIGAVCARMLHDQLKNSDAERRTEALTVSVKRQKKQRGYILGLFAAISETMF